MADRDQVTRPSPGRPLFLFLLLAGVAAGESVPTPYLKSASGRFATVGADAPTRLAVNRWAEETADRVEKRLGFDLPFEDRLLRLVLIEGADDTAPRLDTAQGILGGRFVQRLTVVNYAAAAGEDLDEAFCRLVLTGPGGARVPAWLSWGVAQNLDTKLRARNGRHVLARRQAGDSPLLVDFLRRDGGASPDRGYCGLLVAWLSALPQRAQRFRRVLDRVSGGKPISPEWLLTQVPGCESVVQLEERWDEWILRQKRVVYVPGRVTRGLPPDPRDAGQLLSPGAFGTSVDADQGEGAHEDDKDNCGGD